MDKSNPQLLLASGREEDPPGKGSSFPLNIAGDKCAVAEIICYYLSSS